MAFLKTVVRSLVLVGSSAAWLQAQSYDHVTVAPQGRPRIASIAPPPAAPQADDYGPTVFSHLAAETLPDGRVVVDLGNAYREVAEPCLTSYAYQCFGYGWWYPVFWYPTVFYAPVYAEPVYVAPVYAAPVYAPPVYPRVEYPAPGYYVEPRRVCSSCGYQSRTYVRSAPTPAGAVHAAPPRAAPGRVVPPVRR